jgi:hypothetical protein
MKILLRYGLLMLVWHSSQLCLAQEKPMTSDGPMLTIRGSVRESDTYKPNKNVNIEINGGA